MNTEKEIKKLKWIEIIIILVVCLMLIFGCFFGWKSYHAWLIEKKIEFMMLKISRLAAVSIIKWSDYYDLDWLKIYNCLMTESNGKQYLVSRRNCKGYMQLARLTAVILRERLQDKIKDCSIYATEFQIAAGCLHLKNLADNFCGDDWMFTIEIYNVGWHNYRWKKKRGSLHTKRYGINYIYFKTEWNNYKKLF